MDFMPNALTIDFQVCLKNYDRLMEQKPEEEEGSKLEPLSVDMRSQLLLDGGIVSPMFSDMILLLAIDLISRTMTVLMPKTAFFFNLEMIQKQAIYQ